MGKGRDLGEGRTPQSPSFPRVLPENFKPYLVIRCGAFCTGSGLLFYIVGKTKKLMLSWHNKVEGIYVVSPLGGEGSAFNFKDKVNGSKQADPHYSST